MYPAGFSKPGRIFTNLRNLPGLEDLPGFKNPAGLGENSDLPGLEDPAGQFT